MIITHNAWEILRGKSGFDPKDRRCFGKLIVGVMAWLFLGIVAQGEIFQISHYEVVRSQRVSRTEFELELKAQASTDALWAHGVKGRVTSSKAGLTVIDGEMTFGTLTPKEPTPSQDTIRIRMDRAKTGDFQDSYLAWTFEGLLLQRFELVQRRRVTRTEFEYEVRAIVSNLGPSAQRVRAFVHSSSPDTVILDGELTFEGILKGGEKASSDTILLRQDRKAGGVFDPKALEWRLERLILTGFEVVSRNRVGRSDFEFVLRARLLNDGPDLSGFSAEVSSNSSGTTLVDGNLSFGSVRRGEEVLSEDTLTLRQNRLQTIDLNLLKWQFQDGPIGPPMMPEIAITSPVDGLLTNSETLEVFGQIKGTLNGVAVNGVSAVLSGQSFRAIIPLKEGRNVITALGFSGVFVSAIDSIQVNRDRTSPIVNIETPPDGSVFHFPQITVAGMVNDVVSGTVNANEAQVTVNGVEARVVNRSYEVQDLLLVKGDNTIRVEAMDRAGNTSVREIQVRLEDAVDRQTLNIVGGNNQSGEIGTVLPQPLVIEALDANGVVKTNLLVRFSVIRNDGVVSGGLQQGREVVVRTDENGLASAFYQLGTRTGVGNNQVRVTAPGFEGDVIFCQSASIGQAERISALLPETQVGEPGLELPQPWTVQVFDQGGNPVEGEMVIFEILAGDGRLDGQELMVTLETDSDGRASVMHRLGPEEGFNNQVVLATIAGLEGEAVTFTASAKLSGPIQETRLAGVVLDNGNRPIPGVTAHVEGTDLSTLTDDQGQFILVGVPVGAVRLLVDGRTTPLPGEWPVLEFDLVMIAGQENSVDRPIYLLPLDTKNSAIVGGDEDITLQMEGIPGAEFTIFANSVTFPDGSKEGRVLWTQVNLERVPMPPPLGSQFMLAWTVQPAGVHFDPPARICIPNMGGAPGQQVEIFSFDHDLGEFAAVGTATITDDGSQMCSDGGFGVTKSGWGGCVPPPPPCTIVCGPPPTATDCVRYIRIPPARRCDCPTYRPEFVSGPCDDDPCIKNGMCQNGVCEGDRVMVTMAEALVEGEEEKIVAKAKEVHFTATAMSENCDSLEYEWDFMDGEISNDQNPTHTFETEGTYEVKVTVKCAECPMAMATDTVKVFVTSLDLIIHKPLVLDPAQTEIAEAEEESKGSQTWVNLDNDDKDTAFDTGGGDMDVTGGDDELMKLIVRLKNKDLKEGKVKIEATAGGGDIKLWKKNTKDTEFAVGSELMVPADFMVKGDALEAELWVEGVNRHTSQRATKLKMTFDQTEGEDDTVAMTILGVEELDWEGKGNSRSDSNTLDADPNWPGGVLPTSVRVFPDARTESGSKKDLVTVKIKLSVDPVFPVKLALCSFDVDDPTKDMGDVDEDRMGMGVAEDNRGTSPDKEGKLVGADGNNILDKEMTTKEATTDFQVTMNPGDNFRMVASGDRDFLLQLKNDETQLGNNGSDKQRITDPNVMGMPVDQEVREANRYLSKTVLTVWRFIHVEKDSMEAVGADENIVNGSITDFVGTGTAATQVRGLTVSLSDTSPDLDAGGGNGRFENGRMVLGTGASTITINPVSGNGARRVVFPAAQALVPLDFSARDNDILISPGTMSGTVTEITKSGGSFILTLNITANNENPIDWMDFIGGTVSIGGGDTVSITAVNSTTKTLTVSGLDIPFELRDDDSRTNTPAVGDISHLQTVLREAYVETLDDGGGDASNNTQDADFLTNLDISSKANGEASFDRDSGGKDEYWVAYLLVSHQYSPDSDTDPNGEGGTGGVCWAATSNTAVARGGDGTQVFTETVRDRLANGATAGLSARVIAHEVGHQLGLDHWDSGEAGVPAAGLGSNLMLRSMQNVANNNALLIDMHKHLIRSRVKSPGK